MTANEFIALMAEMDSAIRRRKELEHQIERGKRSLVRLERELSERVDARRAKEEETKAARSLASDQELEASQVAQRLALRREQLGSAGSDREYSAIKLQIELDEKKNDALADATLETLSQIDRLQEELQALVEDERAASERLENQRADFAELEPELRGKIQDARAALTALETRLPREFQGIYSEAVSRWGRDDARAPLDGEYCGSCNQGAPIDLVLRARSGQPVQCLSCGRLLYLPDFD